MAGYDFSKKPNYKPTLKGAGSEDIEQRRSREESDKALQDLQQQLNSPSYDPGAGVRTRLYPEDEGAQSLIDAMRLRMQLPR